MFSNIWILILQISCQWKTFVGEWDTFETKYLDLSNVAGFKQNNINMSFIYQLLNREEKVERAE